MTIIDKLERADGPDRELPTCCDYDSDCADIADKVHCYLYDPAKGMCPYLRARSQGGE